MAEICKNNQKLGEGKLRPASGREGLRVGGEVLGGAAGTE